MVIAVDAHKIAYMALPKAGCSSVKEALARIDPAVDVPAEADVTLYTWHEIYPTMRFRPHRWQKYETKDWFGFCVVRDPFKRLMSCYTNRVIELGELKNSPKIRNNVGGLNLPVMPDPDFFFQNLKHYRDMSSVVRHHVFGAWHFIGKDLNVFDKVYKVEDLPKLAADLGDRVGQEITIGKRNPSSNSLKPDDLKPETRDSLRNFMMQEYTHLGAFYDNPLD